MEKTKYLFGLREDTAKLLLDQIYMEHNASAQYLTIASWCDVAGYQGCSKYFYNQAAEEREHMLKLVKFLGDAEFRVIYPTSIDIISEFHSLKQIFEISLEAEEKTTHSIHKLVDHCNNQKDFSALNFLQWYISEQIEEEITVRKILSLFDIMGNSDLTNYNVDQEVGKIE